MLQICFISRDHDNLTDLHVNLLKQLIDNDENITKYITETFTNREEDLVQILSKGKMHFFSIEPIKEINTVFNADKLEGYVLVISYNLYITKIKDIAQIIIDIDRCKIYAGFSDNIDMSEDDQTNLDLMNKYLDFKKAYEKKVGNMSTTEQALAKLFGGLI